MKILIVKKLNWLNIIIVFLLRLVFSKIYFIEIAKYFKFKKLIKFFSIFNVSWFNYQEIKFQDAHIDKMSIASNMSKEMSDLITEKLWNLSFTKIYFRREFFSTNIQRYIYNEMQTVLEIFLIAYYFKKKEFKIYLWIPNSFIYKFINQLFYPYIIQQIFFFLVELKESYELTSIQPHHFVYNDLKYLEFHQKYLDLNFL